MEFTTDIQGPWIPSNDFGDPLTFPIAPPTGQSFHLHCDKSQHLHTFAQLWYRHPWSPDGVSC